MKAKNTSTRRGVLAGGNWIIDQVKLIDVYPQREQLANIRGQVAYGTGGAPYNVLVDVAKTGAGLPLFAAGLVGKDAFGTQILAECKKHKIDPKFLKAAASAKKAQQEATRMGLLVDDLLLLAQFDEDRPLDRQPVDRSDALRSRVWHRHRR